MRKLSVQWFPGHMTKAFRMMEKELKLIDVAVEMLDARIPYSSSNPKLLEILGEKPRIIALNKYDLADPYVTEEWVEHYAQSGIPVVFLNSAKGKGIKELLAAIKKAALPITEKWLKKGVKNKSIRVMITGIPNVGKSSLINRFLSTAKVRTENRPGVTRGKQWLSVGGGLEILDTPGVLWPKFEDQEIAFALAITGAIRDEVFDIEQAVLMLVDFLLAEYPALLEQRYNIKIETKDDAEAVCAMIAGKRGCIRSGGVIDMVKTAQLILKEFRSGALGRITLEKYI